MSSFLKEIFDYNHHSNQKLLEVFMVNQDRTSEMSKKLYNHIVNAHQIWNNRITPNQPPFRVWELHPLHELKNIDSTNYHRTLQILDMTKMDAHIQYTNSKGQCFDNTVQDILFHITNHSTYHRGQIASEFREIGIEPLVADYIFYKREVY